MTATLGCFYRRQATFTAAPQLLTSRSAAINPHHRCFTPLNLLFTYITPFHPERGGIGRVTDSLTREFLRRGHKVYYLIYDSAITIHHEYDYPAPLTYLPSRELLSEENITFYQHYLKEHAIDVVINQSGNFSDSALWLRTGNPAVKVISVLHSTPWVAYKHLWSTNLALRNDTLIEKLKRIARILLYPRIKRQYRDSRERQFRMLLPGTDKVCTLSSNYYDELSEICSGYEDKYFAIPNPNSYTEEQVADVTLEKKKKQILFIGLFSAEKAVDRLVKIWGELYHKHPDWHLVIVGDGPKPIVSRLHAMAAKMKNIEFVGFQSPLPYLKESSILCMTSNYEGFPMVLTEAQQCGAVPIAFQSFASVTDIITHDENGILVPPFDMDCYARELSSLMSDTDKRTRLASQAMHDVKRFSVANVVDQWEALLDELQSNDV